MKRSILSVMIAGMFGVALSAQDATRGGTLYKQQCASCHGEGPRGAQRPTAPRRGFPLKMASFRPHRQNQKHHAAGQSRQAH